MNRSSKGTVTSAIAVATIIGLLPAGVRAQPGESQQWIGAAMQVSVSDDVSFAVVGQRRFYDDPRRKSVDIVTPPIITVRLTVKLRTAIGYAYILNRNNSVPDQVENRFWQDLTLISPRVGPGALETNLRVEHRRREDGHDTSWRLRTRVRYRLPIAKSSSEGRPYSLILAAEPFFYLNDADWGPRRGFDQVRLSVGVEVPVSKTMKLDVGYTRQSINDPTGTQNNNAFSFIMTFFLE